MSFEPLRVAMERAVALARDGVARNAGGPFGAVVVRDGRIIGEGQNCVTSTNDPTAHAEVCAIRAACAALGDFRLRGCVLYTSCEPCPMCLAAALWARVDRIVFAATREDAARIGFDDEQFYSEVARPIEERTVPMTSFLREEALAAFEEWERKGDRTPY